MPLHRIKPLLLLLPLLLSGCAGAHQQPLEASKLNDEEMSRISRYAMQIRVAIMEQFSSNQSYKGKMCTLRISLLRSGKLTSATVENGDPDVCRDLLSAVSSAKIPPAPDDKTWQTFNDALLDFVP